MKMYMFVLFIKFEEFWCNTLVFCLWVLNLNKILPTWGFWPLKFPWIFYRGHLNENNKNALISINFNAQILNQTRRLSFFIIKVLLVAFHKKGSVLHLLHRVFFVSHSSFNVHCVYSKQFRTLNWSGRE